MASNRRKTKDDDVESSTALIASGNDDSSSAYTKDKKDIPKTWTRDMTEWVVIFLVCFGGFYYLTFSDHERAHHKKQMDAQLTELAKQFEAQKVALNTQLEGLYQQLFAAEQATKAAANISASTETQQQTEAAPVAASAEEQRLQAEIDRRKAEMEQKQKKIASFCVYCSFYHNGLSTTCGARKDFLVSRHGTDPEVAILAVMEWDSVCSTLN